MRSILIVSCMVAAMLSLRPTATEACGGTLTSVGQGPRFIRDMAKRNPARVAIYAPNSTRFAAFAPQLQSYLTTVGHHVQTVNSPETLKSGQFDLIVTEFVAATGIQPLPSNAVIVPLAYKLSKAEKAQAKAFKHQIKNPDDGTEYLHVIYKIMQSRGSNAVQAD